MDNILHVFVFNEGAITGFWSFSNKLRLEEHMEVFLHGNWMKINRAVRRHFDFVKKQAHSQGD